MLCIPSRWLTDAMVVVVYINMGALSSKAEEPPAYQLGGPGVAKRCSKLS